MNENLISGIIGGIIASAIVGFVILVFNKIIVPKVKQVLYKGIDIEGEWIANYKIHENGSKTYRMKINQLGFKIKGSFTCNNKWKDREDNLTEYRFTGSVRNNFVSINYFPKSSKKIGMGSLLLTVKGGGSTLHGNVTFVEINRIEIVDFKGLNFKRKSST